METMPETTEAIKLNDFIPDIQIKQKEAFRKPQWWDSTTKVPTYDGACRSLVRDFLLGKRTGKYSMLYKNFRHIYSIRNKGSELWLFKDNKSIKYEICMAKKVDGIFIGNASSLQASKKKDGSVAFTGSNQHKIQEVLSDCMPMLPFRIFEEAKLDLNSFELIEHGGEEYVKTDRRWRGEDGKVHFVGAMLFKINDSFYLFDIDRNDIKEEIFNPFLSKLPGPSKTIAEAYASLKPKEVYEAERFLKTECMRQGEWFFIPVQGKFEPRKHRDGTRRIEGLLQSKGHRPHFSEEICEEGYVRGRIRHGGNEHFPIDLPGWHKPVANDAEVSFKISGAID